MSCHTVARDRWGMMNRVDTRNHNITAVLTLRKAGTNAAQNATLLTTMPTAIVFARELSVCGHSHAEKKSQMPSTMLIVRGKLNERPAAM